MILSDKDIWEFMEKGEIEIKPFSKEQLGPTSVDLTLDNKWWFFKKGIKEISSDKLWYEYMEMEIREKITLKPGQMCLGITKEKIKLSNKITGLLQGRSRYARLGLSIHITSAFVHAGVDNRQVLEIKNNSPYDFLLREGERVSQIIFMTTKSETSKPYRKIGKISINQ